MPNFRFTEESPQLDLFDDFFRPDKNLIVEDYIKGITRNGALPIFDVTHFSRLVGFSERFLYSVSASPKHFYRTYEVQKKSGGVRCICEPMPTLKLVQRYIIDKVLSGVEPHRAARAFRKNYTLRGAANIHKGRTFMLSLDIKNFFPSISSYLIYKMIFDLGYTSQLSHLLCGICTFNNGLPQGAPTSPMLSNLYMREFDDVIFRKCKEDGIFYTRYADDMTFSSNVNNLIPLIGFVRRELSKIGLSLNNKKTSFSGKGGRKYVNGIVVNKKPNILKSEKAMLRSEVYYIKKYGINGHIRKKEITEPNYIDRLIGKLSHAYFITKDEAFRRDANYMRIVKYSL